MKLQKEFILKDMLNTAIQCHKRIVIVLRRGYIPNCEIYKYNKYQAIGVNAFDANPTPRHLTLYVDSTDANADGQVKLQCAFIIVFVATHTDYGYTL